MHPDESVDELSSDLVCLWLCRAAVGPAFQPLIRRPKKAREHNADDIEDVRELLGLPRERPDTDSGQQEEKLRLKKMAEELSARTDLESGPIFLNLALLGKRIGFGQLEQRIVALRAAARLSEPMLVLFLGCFDAWSDSKLYRILGTVLDASPAEIASCLALNSALCESGLLHVSPRVEEIYVEKINLQQGLISALGRSHTSVESLLGCILSKARGPKLTIRDYPHLHNEISVAVDFLSELDRKRGPRPANILLYGPPGTGKTELAAAITKSLGWTLYDISDTEGGYLETSSMGRIRRLRFATKVLRKSRKSAILFDEVETALSDQATYGQGKIEVKYMVNGILESSEVPMFWITNHHHRLDDAFKRRFDLVIEVNDPPRSVKEGILTRACSGVDVEKKWVSQQASIPSLTPALINRIANVSHLSARGDTQRFAASFEMLRDRHLEVQGNFSATRHQQFGGDYDLEAVSASVDVRAVVHQIKQFGEARCLFHGLPGTGKTAFAHELARLADRQIHVVFGSELVSPFVGVTEQNIAKAFRTAQRDQAVLLVDEADSFLQGRDRARASWEVTAVNEFLQQMECFDGILVCTTNFLESLDVAAMRRFDLKVEFFALRPDQRLRMYLALCSKLGMSLDDTANGFATDRLSSLDTLVLGDFSTVYRRLKLAATTPLTSEVLSALTEEQRYKTPARRSIGFFSDGGNS